MPIKAKLTHVRLLTGRVGQRRKPTARPGDAIMVDDVVNNYGDLIDVPADEAERMIAAEQAELVTVS